MSIFCTYTNIFKSRMMGCHGNHKVSYSQNAFILGQYFFALSGPIEQIYIYDKISYVFNVGMLIPWNTSLPNVPKGQCITDSKNMIEKNVQYKTINNSTTTLKGNNM